MKFAHLASIADEQIKFAHLYYMNSDLYYYKYLKYRTKYHKLNQIGASTQETELQSEADQLMKNDRLTFTEKRNALIRLLYRGTKFSAGLAGTVLSLGAGGDTIPDIIFLIADTNILASHLNSLYETGSNTLKLISKNKWEGDPEKVKSEMIVIFDSIDMNPNAKAIYKDLCESYKKILDDMAAMISSLIAALIPDDAGIGRTMIEQIILTSFQQASKHPYNSMTVIFNKLPPASRNLLVNKSNLKNFLLQVINYVTNLFPSKDKTWKENLKANIKRHGFTYLITIFIPGSIFLTGPLLMVNVANTVASSGIMGDQIIHFIENEVKPNIDNYVELIYRMIPLMFAMLLLVEKCN